MPKREAKRAEPKVPEPVNITIKTGTVKGSLYSQIVSVTITDIDITLEFVYLNPRAKTEGEVVARITLPRQAGEALAKTILDTVTVHEGKKQKEKHGTN